jgi:Holliday junction resolvase
MANPSKQKGTAAETALLRWLLDNGTAAVRNPPGGNKDVGDLVTSRWWPGGPCVIEVKNMTDVARAINEGIAELEVEKANAGTRHGVLVVKRRGKGDPGEWLAIRRVCDDPELGRP